MVRKPTLHEVSLIYVVRMLNDFTKHIPKASEKSPTVQIVQGPCTSLKTTSQAEEQAA